jgi:RND family efflux transporter MFP subunit
MLGVEVNRRRNLGILLGAFVLIIVIGVFAAQPHGKALPVRTITAAYGRYQTKLPETGVIQRPQTQTLAALVAGNVGEIYVHAGQHVVAGQLLATIENPALIDAEATAHEAYLSAQGRARTAEANNATLPAQNRSSVVQAEAALETARFTLNAALQDQRAGVQSGLGYGGSSAAQQRAAADTTVAERATDLREAKRIADADKELYAQKAIAKNALDTDIAKLEQAQDAYDQAVRDRNETYAQIGRQTPVLADRVRADRDAVTQAQAALIAARASASEDKSGDVEAARADAEKAFEDWRYAAAQVGRLHIVAPFSGVVQTIATETSDSLRTLQPGDAVTVGQAMVTISSDSGFVVRAKVDEQDVAAVLVGQAANVSGEDLGTAVLPGHVAQIGATAQKSDDPSNTSRQVLTTIALDGTRPFLRDGMTVDVDIITVDLRHALAVPADAVAHDAGGKAYVFVVKNGLAKKTPVTVGPSNDAQAVITRGIAVGDVIVAERNVGIVDGLRVSPTAAPAPSPSPSG